MWTLFPDHPYLLNSQFELTDDLRQSGYVEKPIVGRSGENIAIIASDESVLRETDGRFGSHKKIYQRLCPLPKADQMNVQVCTFSVTGSFAGACVRVDPSLVIKGGSDVMPLRIVSDDRLCKHQGKRSTDSRQFSPSNGHLRRADTIWLPGVALVIGILK